MFAFLPFEANHLLVINDDISDVRSWSFCEIQSAYVCCLLSKWWHKVVFRRAVALNIRPSDLYSVQKQWRIRDFLLQSNNTDLCTSLSSLDVFGDTMVLTFSHSRKRVSKCSICFNCTRVLRFPLVLLFYIHNGNMYPYYSHDFSPSLLIILHLKDIWYWVSRFRSFSRNDVIGRGIVSLIKSTLEASQNATVGFSSRRFRYPVIISMNSEIKRPCQKLGDNGLPWDHTLEVDGSRAISVDLVNDAVEFGIGQLGIQFLEDLLQRRGRDKTISWVEVQRV